MLPFSTTATPNSHRIGNPQVGVLELPRLGGLTVDELLYIAGAELKSWHHPVAMVGRMLSVRRGLEHWQGFNLVVEALNNPAEHQGIKQEIEIAIKNLNQSFEKRRNVYATAMLRRTTPAWHYRDTVDLARTNSGLIEAVHEFACLEERGWEEGEGGGFTPVKNAAELAKVLASAAEPAWGEVFWEMQKYWPDAEDFNSANFAKQPVWRIMEALKQGRQNLLEHYHALELPIASLHSSFVRSKIDPKKTAKKITAKDFFIFQPKSRHAEQIPTIAANAFFECSRKNILPGWVLRTAPLDELMQRENGELVNGLHLFGEGIALFNCLVGANSITASLMAIDGCKPESIVSDPMTQVQYKVESPYNQWETEIELRRIEI